MSLSSWYTSNVPAFSNYINAPKFYQILPKSDDKQRPAEKRVNTQHLAQQEYDQDPKILITEKKGDTVKVNKLSKLECLSGIDCVYSTPYDKSQVNVVPFNSNRVKRTGEIVGTGEIEGRNISLALKRYMNKYSQRDLYVDEPFNSKYFRRFPQEVQHPLKERIVNFFKSQLRLMFPKEQVQMSGDIFLIAESDKVYSLMTRHSTESEDFQIIAFKVYLEHLGTFSSRRLYVQLLIHSRSKQIVQINHISLDRASGTGLEDNQQKEVQEVAPPFNHREYLELTNTLFLNAPFKTNQDITVITNRRRREWEQSIEHQKVIEMPQYDYACFGVDKGENLVVGTGDSGKITSAGECENNNGVWDKPVSFDSECPFFEKNRNYPNTFGGKRGHACVLPRGAKPLGYRQYSPMPADAPLCYNCKPGDNLVGEGTLGRCCDKQTDRQDYPKLDGPDYAFHGDKELRDAHQSLFTYRGSSTY